MPCHAEVITDKTSDHSVDYMPYKAFYEKISDAYKHNTCRCALPYKKS